jgi:hypothetical protein
VDRPSYSLLSQLGFLPDDLALDALEVSPRGSAASVRGALLSDRGIPLGLVCSSDAHELDDIGSAETRFRLKAPDVQELGLAFRGDRGRRVEIPDRTE